jgi:transglutaminase-like putative cysteine protease
MPAMNSRTWSTVAIVALVVLGGIGMAVRYQSLRREQIALEDSRWELTYVVQFRVESLTGQEEAKVRLAMPFETPYCDVLNADQNTWTIPNPNLQRRVVGPYKSTQNHYLALTTKQGSVDPYLATANFVLRLSPRPNASRKPPLESLDRDAESLFLQETPDLPTSDAQVRQVAQLAEAEAETKAQQIQWIFEYCTTIDSTPEAAGDTVVGAVTNRVGTPVARARTLVTLCRERGIPARLVTGFIISQGAVAKPYVWSEVFHDQEWKPIDPTNGYSFTLPMNYVPVRRDADQVHDANSNVTELRPSFSIKRLPPDQSILTGEIEHPIQILDLTRLPVPMHNVMSLLLLLPFGALITAFVRNVVGVQTFGTFAPALLAMSFIYADWKTGLAILLVVVTAGLVGRLFLDRLRLLMVPRLSIILTLAILCVVFCVSSFDFLGLTPSAQAVLLPMVILTILIERFHVTVEEDGFMFALQLAIGTVVVSMLCFAVLAWEDVGAWVLKYPEVHFFTIAAFIVLGRYAGYRMTELWRFRDLVEPTETVR